MKSGGLVYTLPKVARISLHLLVKFCMIRRLWCALCRIKHPKTREIR
ncbi:Hypothetical protein EAG7_03913 [Klebsiella aerogenes]|nr:Hypothetical protein EAG7_03913 [Klebsiella aerogenes]CCG32489.1 hypothetical protein [Klebsiella aerogenes EA1509E]